MLAIIIRYLASVRMINTAGCRYGHRSSELYANRMYLKSDWYPNDIFYGSNRSMSNNGEFGGASKRNFQRG